MTLYGIRKKSRNSSQSYTGPTWERAGIKKPIERFHSLYTAQLLADILSNHNPVGFEVFELE